MLSAVKEVSNLSCSSVVNNNKIRVLIGAHLFTFVISQPNNDLNASHERPKGCNRAGHRSRQECDQSEEETSPCRFILGIGRQRNLGKLLPGNPFQSLFRSLPSSIPRPIIGHPTAQFFEFRFPETSRWFIQRPAGCLRGLEPSLLERALLQ